MRFLFLSFFIIVVSCFSLKGVTTNELVFKGVYFGENPILYNPMNENEFSIKQLSVNNFDIKENLNSSSIEVDLTIYNFEIGDQILIKIVYSENAGKPIIVNPEAIVPSQPFSFVGVDCDKKNLHLIWSVESTSLNENFEIEQYKWDKWVSTNTINPKELKTYPNFAAPFSPHSGRNLFRIKYIDSEGNVNYSEEIRYTSKQREVYILNPKVKSKIQFTESTDFQLCTENGDHIISGKGDSIHIESLEKGKYILHYDNKTTIISKK